MYESLFYERLSSLRIEKGVSARDMSLTIGQSAGYINSLENQKAYPSMQVFFYICEFLGVTPAEFFEQGNKHPQKYREIIEDLNKLDAETLDEIKSIVHKLAK